MLVMRLARIVLAIAVAVAGGQATSASTSLMYKAVASQHSKPTPTLGYGNEMIFQSTDDVLLDSLVTSSGSALQRFPGGTPSGFWDWQAGWETHRNETDVKRPTHASQWRDYLQRIDSRTIYVPNIVTSNLSYELQGIAAFVQAGVPVHMIELGNEIYDATVPEIVKRYGANSSVYAAAMEPWVTAITRELASNMTRIALCGGIDAEWNRDVLAHPVAKSTQALTSHVYTSLPQGPYSALEDAQAIYDQALVSYQGTASMLSDSQLEPGREVWFTEVGAYGAADAQQTWAKALFTVQHVLDLAWINQSSVVLPYCLVCHGPNAPSFTTPEGPMPPPPNSTYTPGPWSWTLDGFVLSLLFNASHPTLTSSMQLLEFVSGSGDAAELDDSDCMLYHVGVAGSVLASRMTEDASACRAACRNISGCVRWQWVSQDGSCWLKGANATLARNDGSTSGQEPCRTSTKLQGAVFSDKAAIVINARINDSGAVADLSSIGQVQPGSKCYTMDSDDDMFRQNLLPKHLSVTALEAGITTASIPRMSVCLVKL